MKNSTSPLKLFIDESKCQSYSAGLLLQMSQSPFVPAAFLSNCLTKRLAVLRCILLTQLIFFCSKSIHHICAGYFPNSKMDKNDATYSFGARDNSYGFFRTSKVGNIITFKLTYKYAYVTSDARKSSFHSEWGFLWNRPR